MKTEPVLSITGHPDKLLLGSATATAWNALVAMRGHPRPTVLIALSIAEKSWHAGGKRTVKGIWPAGWLRKFEEHIEWVEPNNTTARN